MNKTTKRRSKDELRVRNPFHDPLVTELIEDPELYGRMFSERILIGETLAVFKPSNVVLLGPQGSGKSMILNLIRCSVLADWISKQGHPPAPLEHLSPFFGISVNLVRANFHAFGRRSASRAQTGTADPDIDAACAADFLNHYLLREFLLGLQLLGTTKAQGLREWLGITTDATSRALAREIARWETWYGYYSSCSSFRSLLERCENRLSTWRSFLNANIDAVPAEIWETKSSLRDPLHEMGNLLGALAQGTAKLPLFIVVDQYEVLPELNPRFGTTLQRVINDLIKARDPVVFVKVGARTYDWGTELRVWGAESRIEVQRDYMLINLANVLMRSEDGSGWLFPTFAQDVAYKRLAVHSLTDTHLKELLGDWSAPEESRLYFGRENAGRVEVVFRGIPEEAKLAIQARCGPDAAPLELRLASAWFLQQRPRGLLIPQILSDLTKSPWRKKSWEKERIGIALLQIASLANQRKRYFGWKTILYLSGGNISAFLLLCSEIWDVATRSGLDPVKDHPLPPPIQTEAVFVASEKWRDRDRNEQVGGSRRHEVLSRLGPAIHELLVTDLAISNPGHSGFSLAEPELFNSPEGREVADFLHRAVSWAILEERPHTSKDREGATRRKWYLHPLLSPVFRIPHVRAKEPLYVKLSQVYHWLFRTDRIRLRQGRVPSSIPARDGFEQPELPFGN